MDKQITLDGLKFHTSCAKCMDCQCQITLKNFCKTPDNKLLCKTHYFRRFHEENSYIGGDKFERKSSRDTKSLSPSTSSVDNESYNDSRLVSIKENKSAASIFEKDQLSKEDLPKIKNDDQKPHVEIEIETKPVSVKDLIRKTSSVVSSPPSSPLKPKSPIHNRFASLGAADKCPCCQKTIYAMDKHINLDGTKYHMECAKCVDCKCQITLKNFTRTPDLSILVCKTHYFRRFHEENSYVGGEKFQKTSPRDAKASTKDKLGASSDTLPTSNENNLENKEVQNTKKIGTPQDSSSTEEKLLKNETHNPQEGEEEEEEEEKKEDKIGSQAQSVHGAGETEAV